LKKRFDTHSLEGGGPSGSRVLHAIDRGEYNHFKESSEVKKKGGRRSGLWKIRSERRGRGFEKLKKETTTELLSRILQRVTRTYEIPPRGGGDE